MFNRCHWEWGEGVVQGLRLGICASTAGGTGSMPSWGTRIPTRPMVQPKNSHSGGNKLIAVFDSPHGVNVASQDTELRRHVNFWTWFFDSLCMHAKSPQLCLTLCNPMDCSPPGSSVHGILQTEKLEWVAMASSISSQTQISLSLSLFFF